MKNESKCPLWEKFLNEVLPEKEKQMVLQEWIGAVCNGENTGKMLVLDGIGANGKSVICNVISRLIAPHYVSNIPLDYLLSKQGVFYNYELDDKIINISSGLSIDFVGSVEFRSLVSQETVMGKERRGKLKEIVSLPSFVCMTNNFSHIPSQIVDKLYISRRLLVIKFEVSIEPENQDAILSSKMVCELDGIGDWTDLGHDRYVENNNTFTKL